MSKYMKKTTAVELAAALLGLASGLLCLFVAADSLALSIAHVWPTAFVLTTMGKITYYTVNVALVSFIVHFALLFVFRRKIFVSYLGFVMPLLLVSMGVFSTAILVGGAMASLLHWYLKNKKMPSSLLSRHGNIAQVGLGHRP